MRACPNRNWWSRRRRATIKWRRRSQHLVSGDTVVLTRQSVTYTGSVGFSAGTDWRGEARGSVARRFPQVPQPNDSLRGASYSRGGHLRRLHGRSRWWPQQVRPPSNLLPSFSSKQHHMGWWRHVFFSLSRLAEGERLQVNRSFFDERWTKHRIVTCMDWSAQVRLFGFLFCTRRIHVISYSLI